MTPIARTPTALAIAGSDSGGGAGIQADLKAFARCGVHGMTAITAITAQNTKGVIAVHVVPAEIVVAQVRAVAADIGVDAVKVGMVGTAEVIRAVARALDELPAGTPVVVDPVMVAESGARLLEEDAQRALIEELLPRATVLTPNLPEARVLAGWGSGGEAADTEAEDTEAEELARAVLAKGPREWSSPAGIGDTRWICSSTQTTAKRWRSPESATPTARRTAPAAPTRRCSQRSSR